MSIGGLNKAEVFAKYTEIVFKFKQFQWNCDFFIMNTYFHRSIESLIKAQLARSKSIILLGPRQTGKTTVLKKILDVDFDFNLTLP